LSFRQDSNLDLLIDFSPDNPIIKISLKKRCNESEMMSSE